MTDNGTNFTGFGQFKFALVTSTNLNHQATAVATNTSGFITGIGIVNGGSGYVTAPIVNINGGGGSGAQATAEITGGVVTKITVNSAGSGYIGTPMVTIAPPPADILYTTYWSNDSTGIGDGSAEPNSAISVNVTNGLFTVVLGDTTLANMTAIDASLFNQPGMQLLIWFSNGVDGFVLLNPPQNLTPTPYAIFAANFAASGLSGVYGNQVTLNNAGNSFNGSFSGNGASVTNVNAVSLGRLNKTDFWQTSGNSGTTAGVNFIGTTDNQPLELWADGNRALRLESNSSGSPNIIAGSQVNSVAAGVIGATIAGGGATNSHGYASTNIVAANYAAIGGGYGNSIQSGSSGATIAGGWMNQIQGNAFESTVAGGELNYIETNAYDSTVGGGGNNIISASGLQSVISGGYYNLIPANAWDATIGGGYFNTNGGSSAVISGGKYNYVDSSAFAASIGGGMDNLNSGSYSAISGGLSGVIQSGVNYGTISGGHNNQILSSGSAGAIGGGFNNTVNAQDATVPGGYQNTASGYGSFAAGMNASAVNVNSFVWSDGTAISSTAAIQFMVHCSGGAIFYTGTGTSSGVQLPAGSGSWSSLSDRNSKDNFEPINAQVILKKLAEMPISSWSYKAENQNVRHVGPMAQDFYAAFQMGEDNKHIADVDEGGIALAAIKGLDQKMDQQIKEKDAQIHQLQQTVAQLKEAMSRLAAKEEGAQ